MFGLNIISDFRKESRPSMREVLAGVGALAGRFGGSWSGRGLFFAASLGAGLMGGLIPAVLSHHSLDRAALSDAADKLQKLESERTADAQALGTIGQANAALLARLDTLEKRLGRVERANLDNNPTGAIASSDRPSPPAKLHKPKS